MSTIERDTESSLQTNNNQHITMADDSGLLESYHLDEGGNLGMWPYMMKNHLHKINASTTVLHHQARS